MRPIQKILLSAFLAAFLWAPATHADTEHTATIYKDPQCGCCSEYANYLERHGYGVELRDVTNLSAVKAELGVPASLMACHTAVIGDYVVEGHVPVGTIDRLLDERPEAAGIALPGMPAGSPGMTGEKTAPFTIFRFDRNGNARVYTVE